MAPARDSAFLPEVWALYSLGAAWLVLRILVRIRMKGLLGLDLADALALVALAAWTYTAAVVEITYYDGTNTDYTVDEIATFDEQLREQLKYGSQLFFGSWYAYITLVFSLKGIVIMLYRMLLVERWQRIVFHMTIFMCVAGFTGITLAISLICLPLHKRWQVYPPPPPTCTASSSVLISLACINAFTDVLLLSIPVPLLWTLKIPLIKRIGVFILLSSGFFVLGACILRVSLTSIPGTSVLVIARWGIREIFVAIITVNAAAIRPIFRPSFWTCSPSNSRRSSATLPAHQATRYHFPQPFPRLAARLNRRTSGNQVLDSTSAGFSTVHAWNEAEFGNREYVLEDPDYRVDPNMMSGGDESREETKIIEEMKVKGQRDSAIENVSGERDGSRGIWEHGRSFFNTLTSFGRSDLGSGWTERRNAGDTTTGGSTIDREVEIDHTRKGDRERDLEKGQVYSTENMGGSHNESASARASASFRQVDERDNERVERGKDHVRARSNEKKNKEGNIGDGTR